MPRYFGTSSSPLWARTSGFCVLLGLAWASAIGTAAAATPLASGGAQVVQSVADQPASVTAHHKHPHHSCIGLEWNSIVMHPEWC